MLKQILAKDKEKNQNKPFNLYELGNCLFNKKTFSIYLCVSITYLATYLLEFLSIYLFTGMKLGIRNSAYNWIKVLRGLPRGCKGTLWAEWLRLLIKIDQLVMLHAW